MLRSNTPSYAELRQHLDNVPVIDTHEHHAKYAQAGDTLDFIMGIYYRADFRTAGGEEDIPKNLSSEERYKRFIPFYKKSNKTAYARAMQESLRLCWGVGSIDTFEEFMALDEKLKTRDIGIYAKFMDQMKIKAKIANTDSGPYMEGLADCPPDCRFAFSLPFFHLILHKKDDFQRLQRYLGRPIITLDDYLESFDIYLKKCVDFGVVCMKDQSAYHRALDFGNPTKAEAERVFNAMMFNPRDEFGSDQIRALDDWLFQYAMRAAAKYDLPVQLHTGLLGDGRNDVTKANAAHLIPLMELNRDVRFDLFHGNYPFMDEYLFIGKNYPNAYLNLCWVQTLDPLYCVELMKRAVMTVPHNKLFAFGGDTNDIEWVVGYLALARDNAACALSELVDSGWLDMAEARQIAADWFFNNPNEFYKLGFQPV